MYHHLTYYRALSVLEIPQLLRRIVLLSVFICIGFRAFSFGQTDESEEKILQEVLDQTVILLEGFFSKSDSQVRDGMDIALCRLDKTTNELQYAGANRPLYFFHKGTFNEIKADRQPIGSYEYRKPYTNHTLLLISGDSVYLFSDGIVDQFGGAKSKKFTSRRLKELLHEIKDHSMEEQGARIAEKLESWRGTNESIDDVCVLGVRFTQD